MKLKRKKIFFKKAPQFTYDCDTYEEDGYRYYRVGAQSYPSITSVLGYFKAQAIQEWRNRVGEQEANKISGRAARRGTIIHNMVEKYLLNEDMDRIIEKRNLLDIDTFARMIPTLSRIDNIVAQEQALFSHALKIAGRVDLIAEFDGKLSVIDFKTSLRPKKEEYIRDYFEQTTAYSLMFFNMTVTDIKQIVVIIVNDEGGEPQVFVRDPIFYADTLVSKIETFHKKVLR